MSGKGTLPQRIMSPKVDTVIVRRNLGTGNKNGGWGEADIYTWTLIFFPYLYRYYFYGEITDSQKNGSESTASTYSPSLSVLPMHLVLVWYLCYR